MTFRESFGTKVAFVLDCFKIFIDRPYSMDPRASTWSNYKHHNTVKYLVGIAPQGAITHISRGHGGRDSDKLVTETSGILNNLYPKDVVLADRGFTISDSVAIHSATLAVPVFTRGKKQLYFDEVEKTREIANVRIHVERVIGLVRRKYRILRGCLPVEFLDEVDGNFTVLDQIVTVCCALTNLCKSVVPFE